MQGSAPWGGTVTGDAAGDIFAAPYSDDDWSDLWSMLLTYDRTTQGVIRSARTGYDGNLAVTNPAGTTIRVATGLALVDGKLYANSANVDNSVVAPGGGSNFYRIVLRKDFAAQTVRIALIGPDIVAFPAVTQTDGTLWEIPLAGIEITSAAAVTVTDQRGYVSTLLADNVTLEIVDGILQIKNVGVDTAQIANSAVTTDKIANRTRTLFVPIVYAENKTDSVECDYSDTYAGWIMLDAKDSSAYVNFKVPADYVSDAKISWIAMAQNASGVAYVGYAGGFTSPGATWAAGSGFSGGLGAGIAMVQDVVTELWNASIGTPVAGDIVECNFSRNATSGTDTLNGAWLIVYGAVFSYTADS